jgi:RNA polymerase sigma-70 factor (ECF subfamily)
MAVVTRASPAQVSDAAIIGRSRREPECFAGVFDRYYAQIHGYVARRLGRSMADDVAAETFLIAFARRDHYDTSWHSAKPWLYGIASRLISGQHRAELRRYRALARAGVDEVTEGYDDQVALRVDAQARRGALIEALAGLAERDRDVLLLVACAGLTCEETGQALGIPAGTARSRLHRARKQIREVLGEAGAPATGEDHEQ